MTEPTPMREPTRPEVEAVYAVLGHVSQTLHWASQYLPDSPFMWHCIQFLEDLADSVGERDPDVDAHIHHAARTVESFIAMHDKLADVVGEAERILLAAAEAPAPEEGDGPAEA